MILIGQYDSPFVRRVGIALTLYALPFLHRPWSVFSDADKVRAVNPLMRVPVLVLPDGLALADSHLILDHLDGLVEAPLFPPSGRARTLALRRAALACGAAEKAVSLFYERRLHEAPSALWEDRCKTQIAGTLDALEAEAATGQWQADGIGHDDIALACAIGFIAEAHATTFDLSRWPQIAARARTMEALPAFRAVRQPFLPPS